VLGVTALATLDERVTYVSLAEAQAAAPAGHEPTPGFTARLVAPLVGGAVVAGGEVTAVLERTVVIALGPKERGLARRVDVLVDPAELTWQPRVERSELLRRARRQYASVGRAAQRAASDERAQRDQARHEATSTGSTSPAPAPEPASARTGGDLDSHVDDCPRWEPVETARMVETMTTAAAAAVAVAPSPVEEDGGPAPDAGDPTPPEQANGEDPVADRTAEDDVAEPRLCARCDRPIPRQNRRGICTPCQAVCPECEGPKAIQAEMCKACSQQEPIGPAEEALAVVEALGDLPARVQELLDQVVTLARYARDLEDALDHQQAELRALRRSVAGALARSVA
jgi:hypothetical protein